MMSIATRLLSITYGGIEVDRQGLGDERGRGRLGKCLESAGRRLDAADVPILKGFGKNVAYAFGIARHNFRGKRDAKRKSIFLNLKHGADELQALKERNPELAAPCVAHDGEREAGTISYELLCAVSKRVPRVNDK